MYKTCLKKEGMLSPIPNILSISRIFLSLLLLFLPNMLTVDFIVVYFLCGFTDIADGYFARVLKSTSITGAKLDTIADMVFYSVITYFILWHINMKYNFVLVISMFIAVLIRVINMIMTKRKFLKWNVIHTIGNKIAGCIIYTNIPIFIALKKLPSKILMLEIIIAILFALEETCIIIFNNKYDVNQKAFFYKRNLFINKYKCRRRRSL